jgi:hypothetical protein
VRLPRKAAARLGGEVIWLTLVPPYGLQMLRALSLMRLGSRIGSPLAEREPDHCRPCLGVLHGL